MLKRNAFKYQCYQVSIFVQDGDQLLDGSFVISLSGPVPTNTLIPGVKMRMSSNLFLLMILCRDIKSVRYRQRSFDFNNSKSLQVAHICVLHSASSGSPTRVSVCETSGLQSCCVLVDIDSGSVSIHISNSIHIGQC